MAEDTNTDSFVEDTYNERDYVEDLGVGEGILKWLFKKYDVVTFTAFI
jgi:hypothetical protein